MGNPRLFLSAFLLGEQLPFIVGRLPKYKEDAHLVSVYGLGGDKGLTRRSPNEFDRRSNTVRGTLNLHGSGGLYRMRIKSRHLHPATTDV